MAEVINEIINRRSVRKYKSNPVSDEDIKLIVKAGQFAPSAKNNKSWQFFIIKNQQVKDNLQNLLGQDFISQAPVIIIPAIDPNLSVEPVQDLSVASENIFLQATALGLGTVWKNVRGEFEADVKRIAGIPDDLKVINLIPLGIPNEEKPPHSDSDFDESKIHFEAS